MTYTTDHVIDPSEFPFDIFEGRGEPDATPRTHCASTTTAAWKSITSSMTEAAISSETRNMNFIPGTSASSTTWNTIWPSTGAACF